MNNRIRLALSGLLPLLWCTNAHSQVNVVSSNGYVVDIYVVPQSVIASTTNCTWGYNYNLSIDYQVTFTGSNIPTSLYTLQGTIGCSTNSNFFDLPNNGGVGTVSSNSNTWRNSSDCATISISELDCNTVNIEIQGPGINYQTVSYPLANVVLPVTLSSFTASIENKKVKIQWESVAENNSDYFIVQRSVNQREWIDITKIKAAENATGITQYTTTDNNPVPGISFYRLKQTDKNEHYSFSPISSIRFENTTAGISIFPNPNNSNNIQLNGITDFKNFTLTITDINGQTLYNMATIATSLSLPVLNPGIYLIILTDKLTAERTTLRYVKL